MSRPKIENKSDSKKYKIETICKDKIYTEELDSCHISDLYYLVL